MEEDGSVPAKVEAARCEATVSYHDPVRCDKELGHKYAHQAKVNDTMYQWGDMGRWHDPEKHR